MGTRIFPVHLNQDEALPGIMVTINDVEANPTKTAASTDDFVELDVTIYARSAQDAFTIAELVRKFIGQLLWDNGQHHTSRASDLRGST